MGLRNLEKFGYGTGHIFNDLCSTLWFTYSLLYYKMILGFSGNIAGAIMFIGQLADAIATPVFGMITDRTEIFEKWGKKKSWHFIGTIGVLLSFPFMYSPSILKEVGLASKVMYYCFFVVIFQFSWAVVQVAHLAIVTVLSSDHIERTQLFSIRNAFTFLASIVTYIVSWAILCREHPDEPLAPDDKLKFVKIVMLISVMGVISSVVFYVTVKEKRSNSGEENEQLTESKRQSIKEIFSNCLFYQAAAVYTSSRVFCSVSQSFLNLYLHEDLKMKRECTATVPLVINIVSFLVSWPTTKMNEHYGRKYTFSCGCLLGLSGCTWIWLGDGQNFKKFGVYTIGVLLGSAYPLQLITSLAVTADAIGRDVGNSAFVYGIMSFFEKMTNGLVILLIECLAPEKEAEGASHFYRNSIMYSCGLAMTFGFIFINTIRQTNKDY